jgi:hypothetical protein
MVIETMLDKKVARYSVALLVSSSVKRLGYFSSIAAPKYRFKLRNHNLNLKLLNPVSSNQRLFLIFRNPQPSNPVSRIEHYICPKGINFNFPQA